MIRRLVEVNYLTRSEDPTSEQVLFWLRELRTPELLFEVARNYPPQLKIVIEMRPLLSFATFEDLESGALGKAIRKEEDEIRQADALHWRPLRKKLEQLRHHARRG